MSSWNLMWRRDPVRSAIDILGAETISAVRRPIAQARGLPGVAYTS